jgi:hypothetical protein
VKQAEGSSRSRNGENIPWNMEWKAELVQQGDGAEAYEEIWLALRRGNESLDIQRMNRGCRAAHTFS